jgi:peptidoglycan/LPS O-acetylase OafA/YrhL
MFLTPGLSIYLDLVRLLAAFAVMLGHAQQDGLNTGWLVIGRYSHDAVVVFFVLSGVVIAHTTHTGVQNPRKYAVARLARLYSVVLPAIVLGFVVKAIAAWQDPALATEFHNNDLRWVNVVGSVFFLSESWGFGGSIPWNDPFWSLCYEAWYYVIFGLATFAPAQKRLKWVVLAAIAAGPSIMVMFPIWLLGAYLAKHGMRWKLTVAGAAGLWVVSLALGLTLHETGLAGSVQQWLYHTVPGYWRLGASQRFLTDWVLGVLVAANFVAMRALADPLGLLLHMIARPVQWLAGYTFSLYLFHRPLTEFAGHFYAKQSPDVWVSLMWVIGISACCFALGSVTEGQKGRARNVVDRWLPGFRSRGA